jgi:hypothetical protein
MSFHRVNEEHLAPSDIPEVDRYTRLSRRVHHIELGLTSDRNKHGIPQTLDPNLFLAPLLAGGFSSDQIAPAKSPYSSSAACRGNQLIKWVRSNLGNPDCPSLKQEPNRCPPNLQTQLQLPLQ